MSRRSTGVPLDPPDEENSPGRSAPVGGARVIVASTTSRSSTSPRIMPDTIVVEEPKQITIATDVSKSEQTPITPEDENKGEDAADESSQATLEDDAASIESDAPTDATPPKDNAPKLEREILFTDPGWSRRWAAIHDKTLAFAAPVLRVESGRFFWSSETYNKR